MLTRDHSCLRSLAWNVVLPLAIDRATLPSRLAEIGFLPDRQVGSCLLLRDARANEIAWVAPSGRLQLRLSYLVPEEARRHTAEAVYTAILRLLGLPAPRLTR